MAHKVFVDFDGTIATHDVGHQILKVYGNEDVMRIDRSWIDGEISTRERAQGQFAHIDVSQCELERFIDAFHIESDFSEFVDWCASKEIEVEILSDGFDFYIDRMLRSAGLSDLPRRSNSLSFSNEKIVLSFPHEDEGNRMYGVCKDVYLRSAADHFDAIAFVGDSNSDIPAAAVADIVFAREGLVLAEYCKCNEIPVSEFSRFGDVSSVLQKEWFGDDLRVGQLP